MSNAPHVSSREHPAISLAQARDTRARAWAFVFQCWQEKQMTTEPTAEPDSRKDVSIRNRKEVSNIDHQPDRSSGIT